VRGTVLPGALAIAALTVACGPAREASRASQAADESSVHFRDVTTYVNEGQKTEDVETGAFDWAKHEGWADSGNAHGSSHDLLQVGEDCFARTEEGTWRHWRPEKEENGLCEPDLFQPPGELLRTLRSLGTLDRIGKEKLGGDSSTHYRLTPAENVDIPELWLDVWLDERNLVLRLSQPAGEASPRIRDFFDFGAEVHVTPPCEVMPASRSSAPTQAREKLASCVEDQDWGS
jgi:hypothetical protein